MYTFSYKLNVFLASIFLVFHKSQYIVCKEKKKYIVLNSHYFNENQYPCKEKESIPVNQKYTSLNTITYCLPMTKLTIVKI